MHITSKIRNVHDGNNIRAYLIFHPLRISSEKNAAEAITMISAAYEENARECKSYYM